MLLTILPLLPLLPVLVDAAAVEARRAPILVSLRHRGPSVPEHILKRQVPGTSVGHEALTGLLGSSYLAMDLAIGTPPQKLFISLGLDETPGDLFLTTCDGDECNKPELANTTIFNEKASSTFESSHYDYEYSTGAGEVSADTVTVGGITIKNQPCIYEEDEPALKKAIKTGAGGRVSLGMNGDRMALGGEPFYKTISKQWPSPEFGLFVSRMKLEGTPTFSSAENSGELALGGLNPSLYTGDVVYHPTVGDHWALPLLDFKVAGASVMPTDSGPPTSNGAPGSAQVAFTLNGGSLLLPSFADRLVSTLPGVTKSTTTLDGVVSTVYFIPCDTTESLVLTVGGHDITLPPSAWMYKLPNGQCTAFFAPITDEHRKTYGYDENTKVVLGLHALQTVYTAFKVGDGKEAAMIGFAQLSEEALRLTPNATAIPGASGNPAITATGMGASVVPGGASATGWSSSGAKAWSSSAAGGQSGSKAGGVATGAPVAAGTAGTSAAGRVVGSVGAVLGSMALVFASL